MTPDGVGSCFDSAGQQCSTNFYCAYHDDFSLNGQPVIYANEPYDATIDGCGPGSSPNGNAADATINTISHEQNEAITDPWGNAWQDASGDEVADICAWKFGSSLGGTAGVDEYNQVIAGHHYWLQQEYSNDGGVCRLQYVGIPANIVRPVLTGVVALGQSLSASQGSWTQEPTTYAYQWLRCTAKGTDCANISGATAASHTTRPLNTKNSAADTLAANEVTCLSALMRIKLSGTTSEYSASRIIPSPAPKNPP